MTEIQFSFSIIPVVLPVTVLLSIALCSRRRTCYTVVDENKELEQSGYIIANEKFKLNTRAFYLA